MKLLGNRVMILPQKIEETTKSGIIISRDMQIPSNKGQVIEIGDEVTKVEQGEIIMYDAMMTTNIFIEEVNYLIIRESEIVYID